MKTQIPKIARAVLYGMMATTLGLPAANSQGRNLEEILREKSEMVGEKKKALTEQIDKCLKFHGAGYAIRTRDFQLGKLTLYH